MCGRYVITEEMFEEYERIVRDFDPLMYRFLPRDIFPSAAAPIIRAEGSELAGRNMTFGFAGFEKGKLLINARRETVSEKITYKDSLKERRCVIPAASFYEWNLQKQKAVFTLPEKNVMYLAGIWHTEEDGNHFVILTGAANASAAPVHDRMPLILEREEIRDWIMNDAHTEIYLKKEIGEVRYRMDHEQISLF